MFNEKRAETEIPVSRTVAAEARQWVSDLGRDLDTTSREIITLMLSELVSNSVRHGGLSPDDHVDIRVTRRDGVIRVEVHDEGQGFDLTHVYPPGKRTDPAHDHGYGLQLVDAMSARWGVDPSRPTTVWFEFEQAAG